MKRIIIEFAYWLLRTMGIKNKAVNENEAVINITANDHATPVIEKVKERIGELSSAYDELAKKYEGVDYKSVLEDRTKEQNEIAKTIKENHDKWVKEDDRNAVIDCEICMCMVRKEKAVKGKAVIKKRYYGQPWLKPTLDRLGYDTQDAEYLYYPYYCKRCAPKEKRSDTKKK